MRLWSPTTLPLLLAFVARPPSVERLRVSHASWTAALPVLRAMRGVRTRARRAPRMSAEGKLPDYVGLLSEADRRSLRLSKKKGKAEDKAADCEARQAELLARSDVSLAELEGLPPCESLLEQATAAAAAYAEVLAFADALRAQPPWQTGQPVTSADPAAAALARRAVSLELSDAAPVRPKPPPKKQKGPRPSNAPRKPYRVWMSGRAEIRVGRMAADNDQLSIEPEHRDDADWWMHVAGCPGSHVVIRAESLASASELPDDVAMDAAVLACNNSRATLAGKVGVSICRARQVSKPYGAKDGLVRLSGEVRTLRVDWRKEKHRLETLGTPVA